MRTQSDYLALIVDRIHDINCTIIDQDLDQASAFKSTIQDLFIKDPV